MTDFVKFRFTSGLLPYELTDALVDYQGDIQTILENGPSTMSVRSYLLPNLSSLTDFKERICVGGVSVLLAIARGAPDNDFLIPLQIRSSQVSDGQGTYALILKAVHQPCIDPDIEVNIRWTIFREIYEEIFGGKEVEKPSDVLKFNWYFENPALDYFDSHDGAYNLEITSYGINAIGGNYELATLLAIRDTWYWKTFGNFMKKNWEIRKVVTVSTKDEDRLTQILSQPNWANESLYSFVEGLLRLSEIDSRRVTLPEITRILGRG